MGDPSFTPITPAPSVAHAPISVASSAATSSSGDDLERLLNLPIQQRETLRTLLLLPPIKFAALPSDAQAHVLRIRNSLGPLIPFFLDSFPTLST